MPADVDPATGYRRYRRDQLQMARAVAALRDLELSIPAIRALLEADDPATRATILQRRARPARGPDRPPPAGAPPPAHALDHRGPAGDGGDVSRRRRACQPAPPHPTLRGPVRADPAAAPDPRPRDAPRARRAGCSTAPGTCSRSRTGPPARTPSSSTPRTPPPGTGARSAMRRTRRAATGCSPGSTASSATRAEAVYHARSRERGPRSRRRGHRGLGPPRRGRGDGPRPRRVRRPGRRGRVEGDAPPSCSRPSPTPTTAASWRATSPRSPSSRARSADRVAFRATARSPPPDVRRPDARAPPRSSSTTSPSRTTRPRRRPARPGAVNDLSLVVPAGKICVLVGPSGCGKTTSLKMVNRLIEPTSGRILLDGVDAATRGHRPSSGAASATSSSRPACSRTRRSRTTSSRSRGCSAGRRSGCRPARTSC